MGIQLTVSVASLAFEERAKPTISIGVQEKSDFSCVNGGRTDGEGGSLYGVAPMKPKPAEIERKPHESFGFTGATPYNDPPSPSVPPPFVRLFLNAKDAMLTVS